MADRQARARPSRRAVLLSGIAGAAYTGLAATEGRASASAALRLLDDRPGRPISPLIFGSNEVGVMDGGLPSATLDKHAGITVRRLGGDLMSGYNWLNNADHAGKNHRHANGAFLLQALQVPHAEWNRPAAVIEAMHDASLAMGAKSYITLPLGSHVAADRNGVVTEAQTAPSDRFAEVNWELHPGGAAAQASSGVSIPGLLRHLMQRYGDAGSARGISGYFLDNEPALWFQNHPRLMPQRTTIRAFIARSIAAARVIKAIDPMAKVLGPASWGATEMVSFQDAPDWRAYQRYGSFLAAYLEAFREASEHHGQRLLDGLDVHWYPFNRAGKLFRTEDASLDTALLDAPRSLTEDGYREDSWVVSALRDTGRQGPGLPFLPSMQRLIDRRFPGTDLSITEFNYGGAGRLAAGLALTDVLGRFGAAGVTLATHWGSLEGWLGQAYRLYRAKDSLGGTFAGRSVLLESAALVGIAAHAAQDATGVRLVLINKDILERSVDVAFASNRFSHAAEAMGFDAGQPKAAPLNIEAVRIEGGWRIALPPRSARRYLFV